MILETFVLNPPSKRGRKTKTMKKWYGNPRKKAKKRKASTKKKTVRGKNWKQYVKTYMKKGHTMKAVASAWQSGKVPGGTRKYKRNAPVKRYTLSAGTAPNKRRPVAKRKGKKRYTRKKKAVRRNAGVYRYTMAPVAANPFSRNKGAAEGAMGLVKQTIASPAFWMHTIVPFAGGFFGSKLVSYQLANLLLGDDEEKKAKYWDKPHMKAAWQAGTGILAGIGVGLATRKPDLSVKIVAGSMLASLLTLLEGQEFYQKYTGMNGIDGLGADVSDELKRKISASIQEEIESAEGVSDYVTIQSEEGLPGIGVDGIGDFVTMPEVPEELEGISLSSW